MRFLPADGADHEGTLVPGTGGHVARVYAVWPQDGEPGTPLDVRFRKAAVAAGCGIVGMGDHSLAAPEDSSKQALIVAAIEKLVDLDDPEDMDGAGRPKLASVKKAAGFTVTKVELDAAWVVFVAELEA